MNQPIAPYNAADPLSQLKDIHLPDAPGLWPLAPGWWVLAIVVIAVVAAAVFFALRYWRNNQYRKAAALEADALLQAYSQNPEQASSRHIEQAMALLKRVARHRYPNESISTLNGAQCLMTLNQHCKNPVFTEAICQQIEQSLYAPQPTVEIHSFHPMMKTWIKRHR
ncbi:MAG: DUF4381 domain-containing protein [Pseudomonadales bacterium]|nr:DUF4381 domain-containing protein [Pseudomonadales bacterium]